MPDPVATAHSTLILGGARSGKSTLAQELAARADQPVSAVVTADLDMARAAGDTELLTRIERHQADRPAGWLTIEAGPDLVRTVEGLSGTVLIDCVTMWLASLLEADEGNAEHQVEHQVERLMAAIRQRGGVTIVVSNEVGHGLVPSTPLGRSFRDLQGRANQALAAGCDRAVLVVAGMALPLTDPTHLFEELA